MTIGSRVVHHAVRRMTKDEEMRMDSTRVNEVAISSRAAIGIRSNKACWTRGKVVSVGKG